MKHVIVGVLIAIAVTTSMDANGLSEFSALPLLPLMILFWFIQRFTRVEVGFVWGRGSHYGLAIFFPLIVLGAAVTSVFAAGVGNTLGTDWQKTGTDLALMTAVTIIGTILTEEGFFRGWLWASLKRAGQGEAQVLVWSSVAFSLWHLSAVTLETGFDLPNSQIPVYMVNAALIGAIWGMMRMISGSVIVASVSHGLWNGIAYTFFGFGSKVGALGVKETSIYGPEVGGLGLVFNLVFAAALWLWWTRRHERHGSVS
jgi:membrane protease YdiL (CAAX protease family)